MHQQTATTSSVTPIARRLSAFVVERYPFALAPVASAIEAAGGLAGDSETAIDAARAPFESALRGALASLAPVDVAEPTPGVSAAERFRTAVEEIVAACDGVLRRAALRASLTAAERLEILHGMLLTRGADT